MVPTVSPPGRRTASKPAGTAHAEAPPHLFAPGHAVGRNVKLFPLSNRYQTFLLNAFIFCGPRLLKSLAVPPPADTLLVASETTVTLAVQTVRSCFGSAAARPAKTKGSNATEKERAMPPCVAACKRPSASERGKDNLHTRCWPLALPTESQPRPAHGGGLPDRFGKHRLPLSL